MKKLTNILKNHGIYYKTVNSRIIATENIINENGIVESMEVDLTDYTKEKLLIWLGY